MYSFKIYNYCSGRFFSSVMLLVLFTGVGAPAVTNMSGRNGHVLTIKIMVINPWMITQGQWM